MRYEHSELQDRLASEFVLGNLRGGARRRLLALMRRHPGLRDRVGEWEERLYPIILRAPRVKAPRRIWRAVHARIAPARQALRWWRRLAFAGFASAAAAVLYFGVLPRPPAITMVAVLHDQRAAPGIVVSWTARQAADRKVNVRILAHPDMQAGTSWEAWLIDAPGGAAVSLGLVSADEQQVLTISAAAQAALPRAAAIGVSVEPKGGSSTGRPTLPFLFQGTTVRVEG